MNKQAISLDSLRKALQSLESAIQQPINEFTRDSVIQRFEYTFELCWKLSKKILEADRPLADDSVKGVFRELHAKRLVNEVEPWFALHKARNLTSHTYNENTAQDVYVVAIELPKLCHGLLASLEKYQKNS